VLTTTKDPSLIPPFYALAPAAASPSQLTHSQQFQSQAQAQAQLSESLSQGSAGAAQVQSKVSSWLASLSSPATLVSFQYYDSASLSADDSQAFATAALGSASANGKAAKMTAAAFTALLNDSPAVLFPPSSLPALFLTFSKHAPLHHSIIFVGLIFCFIGDVALLGSSPKAFLLGLAAFLIGHVAFALAHASRLISLPTVIWSDDGAPAPGLLPLAGALAVALGLILAYLSIRGTLRKQSDFMWRAVIAYVAVIAVMVFLAASVAMFTPAAHGLRPAVGTVIDAVVDGRVITLDFTSTHSESDNKVDVTVDSDLRNAVNAVTGSESGKNKVKLVSVDSAENETLDKVTLATITARGVDAATGAAVETTSQRATVSSHGADGTPHTSTSVRTATTTESVIAGADGSAKLAFAPYGRSAQSAATVSVASLWRGLPALSRQAALAMAAAVLFMVSDVFVARERFVAQSSINQAIGLPLYFGAQLVLAAALKEV